MHKRHRLQFTAASLFAAALSGSLVFPAPLHAEPSAEQTLAFDIPKQDLVPALTEYARQTGVQLLYSAQLAESLTANAIKGRYTPQQALERLLEGSGISYRTVDGNVITLEIPKPAA